MSWGRLKVAEARVAVAEEKLMAIEEELDNAKVKLNKIEMDTSSFQTSLGTFIVIMSQRGFHTITVSIGGDYDISKVVIAATKEGNVVSIPFIRQDFYFDMEDSNPDEDEFMSKLLNRFATEGKNIDLETH